MSNTPLENCPGCQKSLDPAWSVCPHCGLRIKPVEGLMVRAIFWTVALAIYSILQTTISKLDSTLGLWFLCLIGLPFAYVFGKAVLFRIMGKPLTLSKIGETSLKAVTFSLMTTVVLPVVVGTALFLLLFAVCLSSGMFGAAGH